MTIINTGVYMRLFHYVHCPFCVRVRMVLGFLDLQFESEIVPYNEEEKLIRLTGRKMLPIMEIEGKYINESLDLIAALDKDNKLSTRESIQSYQLETEPILNSLGKEIHSLAMPYWSWTPEFNEDSRQYFQSKKEAKRGPFKELVWKQVDLIKALNTKLEENSYLFERDLDNQQVNLTDILVASHLWGMYIVPEFQFSEKVHKFLQNVKRQTQFDYHRDFWV